MTDERTLKHQAVSRYLQAHRLQAVVLGRRCNFSWYTAGARNYVGQACDVGNSHLVVTAEGATVVTSAIEAPRLETEELAGAGIAVEAFPWTSPTGPAQAIRQLVGSARVAVDAPLPTLEADPLGADFDGLRWALCEQEMARYREVCSDTVAAVESAARSAEPGWSEYDLAATVSAELLLRRCLPWTILVAGAGRAGRFRHPLPVDGKLDRYFMIVACGERGGLIANCSRLACFGKLPADLAGATLGAIFAQAQAAYAAEGFPDEWRHHHQGGSCGYLPREVKAAPGNPTVVLADQAFAWNPSIAGTKSEDTILCRAGGCEVLGSSAEWPTVTGRWGEFALPRPAILER
jgi:antitoxin VapB